MRPYLQCMNLYVTKSGIRHIPISYSFNEIHYLGTINVKHQYNPEQEHLSLF